MNGFDLVLIGAALLAAVGGWRLGFLRRLSGWIGAGIGLLAAILLAPSLVDWLRLDSDLSVFLVCTALVVLLASIGQAAGAAIGVQLRHGVDSPHARNLDALGGSLLGAVAVLVVAWLIVPVMADTQGWPSAAARGSVIAGFVVDRLPPPPPQITQLERELTQGGYPRLFEGLRRAPDIPPAPTDSGVSQELLERVASSVVRIEGPACGRLQSGSGFFVAPGVVATNAHVVAGSDELELTTPDGAVGVGRVISYEPGVDLALVGTGLERAPLELAPPSVGDRGLVLGFPGGGPFDPSPFAVGEAFDATGFDIYDQRRVSRRLLALASALEPGDSGSAVLRDDGRVVAVAVAVAPDRADVAYALDVSELVALLDRGASGPVSTGACAR